MEGNDGAERAAVTFLYVGRGGFIVLLYVYVCVMKTEWMNTAA